MVFKMSPQTVRDASFMRRLRGQCDRTSSAVSAAESMVNNLCESCEQLKAPAMCASFLKSLQPKMVFLRKNAKPAILLRTLTKGAPRSFRVVQDSQ